MTPELMDKMFSGGWDSFENLSKNAGEDLERQNAEMLAEAATIAAPFRTPEGKRCLELLFRKTIARPLIMPIEGMTLEQQALYASRREGQNGVVAIILNALSIIADGKADMPERGSNA